MKARLGPPLSAILLLLLGVASAETLSTPRLTCKIVQTEEVTTLTTKVKGSDKSVVFRVDWKNRHEKAQGFKASKPEGAAITSTYRLGKTTITRTILASATADCILLHVISDQPGAVSFNARFVSKNPVDIINRREIILPGKDIQAHAWVIPFESDVHDDGKSTIFLNGEGEALIILNLTSNPETTPISNTLTRLGKKHDPGHTPPSPHLIWVALEEGVREGSGEGENE